MNTLNTYPAEFERASNSNLRAKFAAYLGRLAGRLDYSSVVARRGRYCRFDSGYENTYPHAVADIAVTRQKLRARGSLPVQQVLLIRRAPNQPIEPDKWALPGGYVEINQGMPEAAACELAEETGLRLPVFATGIIADGRRKNDINSNISFLFAGVIEDTAEPDDPDILPSPDLQEVSVAHWWDTDNLPPLAFDHADLLELHFQNMQANPKPPTMIFTSQLGNAS